MRRRCMGMKTGDATSETKGKGNEVAFVQGPRRLPSMEALRRRTNERKERSVEKRWEEKQRRGTC